MLLPLKRLLFPWLRKREIQKHELSYLFWECTTRCNLNCLHCGSDCAKDSSFVDMPMAHFLKALDTISCKPKNFTVVITGGEPLLRKDLEVCGLEIRKRGFRWSMVSNGMLYNAERHNSLLNAGLGALTISLDGLEANHSWLRNSTRSFTAVNEAISLAVSSSRLNFDIVTCVNRRNVNELPAIYDYLMLKGVKTWRLFTITPIGRAINNPDLFLTRDELKYMLDFIAQKRLERKLDIKLSCEGYVGSYEYKVRKNHFFCRAGINIGSILIDGSISACPNIDRSFSQGNIYSDNFYEVWQSRFSPFRNRSWNRVGKCANCSEYSKCGGNGFHNWHGGKQDVLVCHQALLNGNN